MAILEFYVTLTVLVNDHNKIFCLISEISPFPISRVQIAPLITNIVPEQDV